jgi:hypothetical protein
LAVGDGRAVASEVATPIRASIGDTLDPSVTIKLR